ncbi:MAG: hypothetical protein ACK5ME_13320 [Parahaliea sp.]
MKTATQKYSIKTAKYGDKTMNSKVYASITFGVFAMITSSTGSSSSNSAMIVNSQVKNTNQIISARVNIPVYTTTKQGTTKHFKSKRHIKIKKNSNKTKSYKWPGILKNTSTRATNTSNNTSGMEWRIDSGMKQAGTRWRFNR